MPSPLNASQLFTKGRRAGMERRFHGSLPDSEGLEENLRPDALGALNFLFDTRVATKTIPYRFPGPVSSRTRRGVRVPTAVRRKTRKRPATRRRSAASRRRKTAPAARSRTKKKKGGRKATIPRGAAVRRTKTGRPFVIMSDGRARFISEAAAKARRK